MNEALRITTIASDTSAVFDRLKAVATVQLGLLHTRLGERQTSEEQPWRGLGWEVHVADDAAAITTPASETGHSRYIWDGNTLEIHTFDTEGELTARMTAQQDDAGCEAFVGFRVAILRADDAMYNHMRERPGAPQ